MGKVKKLRQKYHLSIKKSKSLNNLTDVSDVKTESKPSNENLFKSTENIFAGIDISFDDLTKKLPDDLDVRSVVSTKSRKELKEEEKHLTKKEKQKLRHERFMKKLEVARQVMESSKMKKKMKKKKKVLGDDMSSLLEALPSLQSLAVDSLKKKSEKPKRKVRGILKAKQRLKQQSNDVKLFNRILDDKNFQMNPMEAISRYLKEKISTET